MKLAVITLRGSAYGKRLLHRLAEGGQPADLVVVVTGTRQRNVRLLRGMARRIGWIDALRYAVDEVAHRALAPPGEPGTDRAYPQLARVVVQVASVRGPEFPVALASHGVDLVLLGQSGIVPAEALQVPRLGTLNAHPGWLPEYRGVDCAEWALLQEQFDKVGSSLHWVDAGIDTGRIVRRTPYQWRGDETLTTLTTRLYDDCLAMLTEAAAALRSETLPALANESGRQYYKMSWARRRAAAVRLAAFLARRPLPAASN